MDGASAESGVVARGEGEEDLEAWRLCWAGVAEHDFTAGAPSLCTSVLGTPYEYGYSNSVAPRQISILVLGCFAHFNRHAISESKTAGRREGETRPPCRYALSAHDNERTSTRSLAAEDGRVGGLEKSSRETRGPRTEPFGARRQHPWRSGGLGRRPGLPTCPVKDAGGGRRVARRETSSGGWPWTGAGHPPPRPS